MVQHAAQFAAAGIPWLFDPGQGLPMFDGPELQEFIGKATWVAVNDYEGQMLQERTGWSAAEIASKVRAYIVTKGGEGSVIYADGREYRRSRRQAGRREGPHRLRRRLPGRTALRPDE